MSREEHAAPTLPDCSTVVRASSIGSTVLACLGLSALTVLAKRRRPDAADQGLQYVVKQPRGSRTAPRQGSGLRDFVVRPRLPGEWEAWLAFFAEAILVTATQAVETAQQLLDLSNQERDKIGGLGRAAASTLRVHRALMGRPIATSGSLVERTGITPATVNKALGHLQQLGIVKELTSRKRNRLFSYAGYVEIMSRGTELPGK